MGTQKLKDLIKDVDLAREEEKHHTTVEANTTVFCNTLVEGKKYDTGKLRWNLLPSASIRQVIKVLMYGADKYGDFDWKKVTSVKERYYNAAMRHLNAWWEGEVNDPETKLHHLAHASCCLLFLIHFDIFGKEE